jgi:hypothetical protein
LMMIELEASLQAQYEMLRRSREPDFLSLVHSYFDQFDSPLE